VYVAGWLRVLVGVVYVWAAGGGRVLACGLGGGQRCDHLGAPKWAFAWLELGDLGVVGKALARANFRVNGPRVRGVAIVAQEAETGVGSELER